MPHPDLKERIRDGECCLLSLDDTQIDHLVSAYSHFYERDTLETSSYPRPRGWEKVDKVQTIKSPALLVASKRLPREVAREIANFLRCVDSMDDCETETPPRRT